VEEQRVVELNSGSLGQGRGLSSGHERRRDLNAQRGKAVMIGKARLPLVGIAFLAAAVLLGGLMVVSGPATPRPFGQRNSGRQRGNCGHSGRGCHRQRRLWPDHRKRPGALRHPGKAHQRPVRLRQRRRHRQLPGRRQQRQRVDDFQDRRLGRPEPDGDYRRRTAGATGATGTTSATSANAPDCHGHRRLPERERRRHGMVGHRVGPGRPCPGGHWLGDLPEDPLRQAKPTSSHERLDAFPGHRALGRHSNV